MDTAVLERCPICRSTKVSFGEDETGSGYIHCSGCHWTFLPKNSWSREEAIRRYNARNKTDAPGDPEEESIEELLAQCLRFREGAASNTSLYPLEGCK